jgi:hypothetical protein
VGALVAFVAVAATGRNWEDWDRDPTAVAATACIEQEDRGPTTAMTVFM